jgi:hypothetical protein
VITRFSKIQKFTITASPLPVIPPKFTGVPITLPENIFFVAILKKNNLCYKNLCYKIFNLKKYIFNILVG